MHGGRHCSKNQQLNGTWREIWPSHSIRLKLAIPPLDSRLKIWCGGAISTSGTHSTVSTHYGPSCKVALRGDCSSRKPWTAGTLVLGLSQAMLSGSCAVLCKSVSPLSEPIQCISSESSRLFQTVCARAKGFCLIP